MSSTVDTQFWDELTEKHGHTGYADQTIHRYDQPLRLRAVRKTLRQLRWPVGRPVWSALDIGCGTGDFVHLLLEAGARDVHAVDISPAVAERARRRFATDDRVSVMVGKIQTVPLPAATADIITSITVLQHILDDAEAEQALTHLRSVLKPDGVLLVLEIAPRKISASRSSAMIRERSFAECG